jgi:hypothetical protein
VALFCVGAQSAIIAVLRLGLSAVAPRAAQHAVLLPWRGGQHVAAPTCVLVFLPISIGLAILWALHRDSPWAWVYQVPRPAKLVFCNDGAADPTEATLSGWSESSDHFYVQDMMGVCLVLSCLRGIRVNSLKVSWQAAL